jgi:hypothetical protein
LFLLKRYKKSWLKRREKTRSKKSKKGQRRVWQVVQDEELQYPPRERAHAPNLTATRHSTINIQSRFTLP